MTRTLAGWLLAAATVLAAEGVLVVADEIPAMEVLAKRLRAEGIETTIVRQEAMPAGLTRYAAVIVYIHKNIGEPAETAFIDYASSGGKLVLLHHSISSGKRPNRFWLPFLKLTLPRGDEAQGGYRYAAPVTMEIVNLAPKEYITTRGVPYDRHVRYRRSEGDGKERKLPGFRLDDTEVYLNHAFDAPRTILLGVKYTDAKTGKTYMQDRAGWYMRAGQGTVMYFMPGHAAQEFEHPAYARILVNAIQFKPKR